ncbi:RluA family pseudouridine synthase [Tenacibaculum piscium]|uniref:RNA pseudouridine synthase n=1 Tax=Tenacibaculum piscium TaxID=1458515 RepID=A0A2H1YHK8_9FLAO|nr:RluA family pseudouridine synthase [Tenacibaculum piscium]MBE7630003.1 RluA family pseudouridine synthase [Tenacibaculum piscium]MBE7670978.1 RluA family pseudouridine synthase [Tenacibaculum piscium]MBE7686412.1 RluA family pseudouridine synthase [Tenacibaculum piscium]MBE7691111.1 RluA family pseudouridine synthase [Tenacibaculum piscium]SOS74975.1 RNA pseudouridine synthase [Tenacibaculum piscium]
MMLSETHKVPFLEKSIRLQEYAVGIFKTIPTKSGIKKAIKKKLVFVDDKIATTALFINGNEKIELYKTSEKETLKQFEFPLEILFEDAYLAVIYKPAGILVSGNSFATIDNALLQNITKSPLEDATRPRPVHRLDYPTSGLLLIGKTNSSIIALNKLFENKEITKTYHAITIGKIENNGIIDFSIDDKKAQTSYKLIKSVISERFKMLNLVELSPKTGRKHQLRKHLFAINNPILGDKEYFSEGLILNGKGLYLHASTLQFEHPFTKKQFVITKELPKKFKKIISLPTCE